MSTLGSGAVRVAADTSLTGTTARPVRVYNASWISGTTAGDLTLRNGTDTTGAVWVMEVGVASHSDSINFEDGLLFPGGCFVDLDANTTAVVIEFSIEA